MLTNYASIGPSTVTFDISSSFKDKIKESEEKVDKHIDQLEEDIEFFNEKREEHETKINFLMVQVDQLKKDRDDMKTHINWLENRVSDLEDRLNDILPQLPRQPLY